MGNLHHLSETHSLVHTFINELRDIRIQEDRMRFRRNMERLGEIFAVEISKTLSYLPAEIQTPLGVHSGFRMAKEPVILTILRAGMPLFQGLMNYFDRADAGFIAAYRKHDEAEQFSIRQEYVTCPDFNGRPLIIADPMLATGASLKTALDDVLQIANPESLHIVCAIASKEGVCFIQKYYPDAHLWIGAIDLKLTPKAYIFPGLGDAGDLSFGEKLQK